MFHGVGDAVEAPERDGRPGGAEANDFPHPFDVEGHERRARRG